MPSIDTVIFEFYIKIFIVVFIIVYGLDLWMCKNYKYKNKFINFTLISVSMLCNPIYFPVAFFIGISLTCEGRLCINMELIDYVAVIFFMVPLSYVYWKFFNFITRFNFSFLECSKFHFFMLIFWVQYVFIYRIETGFVIAFWFYFIPWIIIFPYGIFKIWYMKKNNYINL